MEQKYGAEWHFDVVDGGFNGDGGVALAFRVEPVTASASARTRSQTRWRFA